MDATVNMDKYVLNIRSAVLIVHNNKVLLHKNVNEEYYALLGGRVQLGESSDNTAIREVKEELGKEIVLNGYCCTVENMFLHKGKEYQEILFVYFGEFVDDDDKKIEETLKNIEGREELEYQWVEIGEFENYDIRPLAVKQVLANGVFPLHVVNDDIRKNEK